MSARELGHRARTEIALALGVIPIGLTPCAVCGESPFGAGERGARGCFGSNFTDYDALADPSQEIVCAGCERLLAGRPGDSPPPLRTRSVLVSGGELEDLDRAGWWKLLIGDRGLPGVAVLSWATSRKRHHWLHAGLSTPERWEVGTDHGTASWDYDPGLAVTVTGLLILGCRKAEILGGHYPAYRLTEAVLALDAQLSPLRGHLILDLVVWAAPIEDLPEPPEKEQPMIHDDDARAAELVAEIAWRATQRVKDGINFWSANGFLVRRLRRFAHQDLRTLVSRLMQECGVGAEAGSFVASHFRALSAEDEASILTAIRERTDLVAALAFDRVQGIRQERKMPEPPGGS